MFERYSNSISGKASWVTMLLIYISVDYLSIIYNDRMPKRQIGIEVLIEDHFWNDTHGRYVYSFHCPACAQLRLTPELGIYRCDCGSWLIVTNQK